MGIKVKPKDVFYIGAYDVLNINEQLDAKASLFQAVIDARLLLDEEMEEGESEIYIYRIEKIGTIKGRAAPIIEPPPVFNFVLSNGTIHGSEEEFVRALEK